MVFELKKRGIDTTALSFRHIGLESEIDGYDQCHAGWDHLLASLRSYAEIGLRSSFSG